MNATIDERSFMLLPYFMIQYSNQTTCSNLQQLSSFPQKGSSRYLTRKQAHRQIFPKTIGNMSRMPEVRVFWHERN